MAQVSDGSIPSLSLTLSRSEPCRGSAFRLDSAAGAS